MLRVPTWSSLSVTPRASAFYLQKRRDEAAFEKLMNNLDSNQDNEVDFQEYCVFLSCIAMMCNEFFEGFPDKQPRKK